MIFIISHLKVLRQGFLLSLFAVALYGQAASSAFSRTTATGAQVATPTRRALLVGISDYSNGTKPGDSWRNLNTQPDLKNMSYVLGTYYNFKDGLRILENENATQENIVREFRAHLTSNAKPGDTIVFYYTGHGFHVPDVSGDETADHEDEVIVTWVPKEKQSLPDKERRSIMYMLDDTFEMLLSELSHKMRGADGKVKGSITVIFDSCNSGSATKAFLIPKGREWDERIDGPRPAASGPSDVASGWLSDSKERSEGVVFIAASQSNQFSYMMPDSATDGSILTYYLSEFLTTIAREKSDRKITYKDMHDRVKVKVLAMGKVQNPQTEGNISSEIFGDGQPVTTQALSSVLRVLEGPTRLELNVGSLHGIAPHSRFDIYKSNSDVKNPANKLAEMDVTEVQSTTSIGTITPTVTPAPQPSAYEAAQAVATQLHFDGLPLKVFVQKAPPRNPTAADKEKALSTAVGSQAFITRDGATENVFDIMLGWCQDERDAWCRSNRGSFFYRRAGGRTVSLGPRLDREFLQRRLLAEWRWRRLANLTLAAPPKVRVDMVAKDGSPIRRDEGGAIVLKPGDESQVFITNNTGAPVFITLIYLKDSGEIEVWPGPDLVNGQQPMSADNKPVHLFNLSDITAPNGTEVEVIKIIATPREADFTGMSFDAEQRKGRKSKGPLNPLEELLFGLVDANAKSGTLNPIAVDNWYTDQITYEIRPN